ncbi:MAG TPA: MqnA/MqnD/SBP family protein [Thermodesulfobacteriota bacterium]
MSKITMRLGHSPDPDDAFMFYGLASGKVSSDKIDFVHVIQEIQSLNERALKGELEVTAVSAHTYLMVQDKYRILSCGASMGAGYGPIVVAREMIKELEGKRIAIPGKLTTAYLLLRIYCDGFIPVEFPFDKIFNAVRDGHVDAGLIIHEGQLTYKDYGLESIFDLGKSWSEETDLPLPLGLNVIKRGFDGSIEDEVLRVHQESIEYGLAHIDEALEYALKFGRGMNKDLGEKFVLMYVNEFTKKMGKRGKKALECLFTKAHEKGLISESARLDILGN